MSLTSPISGMAVADTPPLSHFPVIHQKRCLDAHNTIGDFKLRETLFSKLSLKPMGLVSFAFLWRQAVETRSGTLRKEGGK